MQKENRYYVLKRADLDVALDRGLINSNDVDTLRRIHKACAAGRDATGKKGQDYCVVESDWPMYELVWEYISCWAEGRPNPWEQAEQIGHRIMKLLGVTDFSEIAYSTDAAFISALGKAVDHTLANRRSCIQPDTATRDDRHNNLGRRLCAMLGTPSGQLFPLSDDDIKQRIFAQLLPAKKADHGAVTQGTPEDNTQTMLSLRSQELRLQEENLQKGLRAFDKDKAAARKEIQAAYEALQSPAGYDSLGRVLREVMHQCVIGKGNERHANGKAFIDQPILAYSREYNSPVGLLFQVRKKLDEFDRLDGIARRRELLGAIVYLAALVIFDQEQRGYELMPEAKLNGVGYLA